MKQLKSIHYDNFGTYQCLEDIKNDSVDLSLITCGMEDCAPQHNFGPGKRDEYIFHFILDGVGYLEQDGNVKKLGKNDVFLIWPNETTHYWADKKDPWHYMWIGFRGIKAPLYIKYAGYSKTDLFGKFENCLLVKSYIQQMISCRTYTHANELKRNAALLSILALLIDASNNTPIFTHHLPKQEYIEKAKYFIEANYQENLLVSDIAAYIGIDRCYLTHIFKQILNITPQAYIQQFRINRAALLLDNPLSKISSVARSVGYHDYATFTKLFKKYKGVTPSKYRQKLLEIE